MVAGAQPPTPPRGQFVLFPAASAIFATQMSPSGFQEAAEIASWMNSSNVFWSVLALLLGGGCIYYLFNWLYVRRVQLHQEKLHALYALVEGLIPSDQPGTVLKQISDVIPFIADATHCSIWIVDPARQKLDFGAGSDRPPAPALSLSAIAGAVTCFRNQAVTEVPDAEECPFVNKETVRRLRQKALLYVPIIADRACLGVIEIEDRRRKRVFPAEQKERVEHVAKLAALALWQRAQNSLKDQLYRTEKMAAMGEFIEGVGEELVGPLASILVTTGQGSDDGLTTTQSDLIVREARRASQALSRLVKFARPRQSKLEKINMNHLLEKVADSFRHQWKDKGLKLQLELSKAPLDITADRAHLEELLINILRNAEHFLETLGRQSLEIYSDVIETNVLITITPGGNRAPVADESLHGERTDNPPGLGLAVCRSLIEGAGGSLRVDRGSTRGFCIEVEYPLARESWAASPAAQVQDRRRPSSSATVLVIDDDRASQDRLLHYLTDHSHRMVIAQTVEEGIDLAERGQFDWVMCKVQMGRLSGLEIYNRLRSRAEKFVFLADEKVLVYNEELFSGKDRFLLRKPFRAADIERLLESLESRAAPADESQPAQV